MTNEAMIDALRRAIVDAVEEAFETDDCPNEAAAAAALKMFKPKRLVWVESSTGIFHATPDHHLHGYTVVSCGGRFSWKYSDHDEYTYTPQEILSFAAAQAHADAAHWANTALGDLVGGV